MAWNLARGFGRFGARSAFVVSSGRSGRFVRNLARGLGGFGARNAFLWSVWADRGDSYRT